MMKLFDAHCHLQDPRILSRAPQLIATALDAGVVRFAVNGVSEVFIDYARTPFILYLFLMMRGFSSNYHISLELFKSWWWWLLLQKDWHLVKQMGEKYTSVIPCFGLHPW